MKVFFSEVFMRYFESRDMTIFFIKEVRKISREAMTVEEHIEN